MRFDLRDLERFIYNMGVNVALLNADDQKAIIQPCAKVIKKHIKVNAQKMLKGRYFLEQVAKSVSMDIHYTKDKLHTPYYLINFKGMLDKKGANDKVLGGPERAAAVAFLNEYGVPIKNAQKRPRPFIKEAIYDGLNECEPQLEAILYNIVSQKLAQGWTHITI